MIRKASERGSWGWTRSDRRSSNPHKPLFGIYSSSWNMGRGAFWVHFGAWSKSEHRSESGPLYERYG